MNEDQQFPKAEQTEFTEALEDALDTIESLSDMKAVVEKSPETMTETSFKLLETSLEHYRQRIGLSLECYQIQTPQIALEKLVDTIKETIATIIKAIQNFIQKLKKFWEIATRTINANELRLMELRKAMNQHNSMDILDKEYRTTNVSMFALNKHVRLNRLDSVILAKNLSDYLQADYEINIAERVKKALNSFKPLIGKIKSNTVSESEIEESVRIAFDVFFSPTFVNRIHSMNGEHSEEHPLFFNEDKLISIYNIPSVFDRPSQVHITTEIGNYPLNREATIKATNGQSLRNILDSLEKILEKNNEIREVTQVVTKQLDELKDSFGALNDVKAENISQQLILTKNIYKSLFTMNSFLGLMLNRNSRIINDYAAFIKAVLV